MTVVSLTALVAELRRRRKEVFGERQPARPEEEPRPDQRWVLIENMDPAEAAVAADQQEPRRQTAPGAIWSRKPDPASFPAADFTGRNPGDDGVLR